jgi:uncharacterized protein YkwD
VEGRVRAAAIAILLAALAAGAAEAQEGFRRTPRLPSEREVEAGIAASANAFRGQNGLPDLAPNDVLTGVARAFAAYLARTGRFSHTADGSDPAGRAKAAGYAYCEVAENLARIDENGMVADQVSDRFMDGWEHSAGHRRNLLDAMVTQTGVGVAKPPDRRDTFVAVQVFGRPLSERYAFQVANHTDRPVGYDLDGQRRAIAPSTTVTYTVCTPGTLAFDDLAGGAGRFEARPAALYLLNRDSAGRLRITIQGAGGSRPD